LEAGRFQAPSSPWTAGVQGPVDRRIVAPRRHTELVLPAWSRTSISSTTA
jgi:hypothetical protein